MGRKSGALVRPGRPTRSGHTVDTRPLRDDIRVRAHKLNSRPLSKLIQHREHHRHISVCVHGANPLTSGVGFLLDPTQDDLRRPQPDPASAHALSAGARRLILGGALALAGAVIIAGTIGALN